MLTTKEILQKEVYWLIDYAADILAQHCYNYGQDNGMDCCPLNGKHGCPFACLCDKISGDRWRQYLVDKFNRIFAALDKEAKTDAS